MVPFPLSRASWRVVAALTLLLLASCSTATSPEAPHPDPTNRHPAAGAPTADPTTTSTTTTTIASVAVPSPPEAPQQDDPDVPPPQPVVFSGRVLTRDGIPLDDAVVVLGEQRTVTAEDGAFRLSGIPPETATIDRPGWHPRTVVWQGAPKPIDLTLEPRVLRAIRITAYAAEDPATLHRLLELATGSSVNAVVFDTKDETGSVLYETGVAEAEALGAVRPHYDPTTLVAEVHRLGLYAITRIVAFEDPIKARSGSGHKLAGSWIDVMNPEAWEYPLDLAVEACELGFDEIQFDYIRLPAGRTAEVARRQRPTTQAERVDAVVGFLNEARSRLHPLGCAVSADIFAIVLSSPDDQGIGQRPEELSAVVDAVSPMIYPSHYSDGWLGFAEPNDHPVEVVGGALRDGMPRLAGTAQMRPWLQAFSYTSTQIRSEIAQAEAHGIGWMLWHPGGAYAASSLPADAAVATDSIGIR